MEEKNIITDNYYVKVRNDWFITKDKDKESQEQIGLLDKYNSLGFMSFLIMLRTLTMRNTFTLHLKYIYETLQIDYVKNTTMANKIKDAILQMNNELFVIYKDSICTVKHEEKLELNTTYFCKVNYTLEDKFFTVHDWELDKIIELELTNKLEKGSLFIQFAYFCKSFGGQEKDKDGKEVDNYGICFPSLETIEKNTGLCEVTVLKNNKLLSDNELLLIDNAGINIKNNEVKNASNLYARPIHREQFDKYLEKMKSKVTIKNNNIEKRDKQNEMRRISQLINKFRKDNKILSLFDMNDSEYEELKQLELQYYQLAKDKDGNVKKKGSGNRFLTLKLDSTVLSRLTDTQIEEREMAECKENDEHYKQECIKTGKPYIDDELGRLVYPEEYKRDLLNNEWNGIKEDFKNLTKEQRIQFADKYKDVDRKSMTNDEFEEHIKEAKEFIVKIAWGTNTHDCIDDEEDNPFEPKIRHIPYSYKNRPQF